MSVVCRLAIIVMVGVSIGACIVVSFMWFLVEEVIRRIPMVIVLFLCEGSAVVITEETVVVLILSIVVVLIEHVIMTVRVIAMEIGLVRIEAVVTGVG